MNTIRAGLVAALCVALSACAASPPPPPPAPPPKPPETIDGDYRGTSTRFQAQTRTCPHPGLVRLEVNDSKFQFRWDATTWVDAAIAPDGAVTGSAERITLVGKQAGSKIDGDVTNGDCGLHFTVTRPAASDAGGTAP
jgi:hypothetical protein